MTVFFQNFFINIFLMSLFLLHNGKIGRIITRPIAVTISISYGNPTESGIWSLWRNHSTRVKVQIFASVRVEFQFLLHTALPKACSSGQSIDSGKSLFINLFYMTLNFSNLNLLLCKNEKLPHTYSKASWSMCILEILKRISLFNRQIDTLPKLVKVNRSHLPQLPWQYKELHV